MKEWVRLAETWPLQPLPLGIPVTHLNQSPVACKVCSSHRWDEPELRLEPRHPAPGLPTTPS